MIFSLQYFLNQIQLQNADILQLVVDSAAVFMSTQVPGVILEKNTYGCIPHHALIICCSPRSLNGILQAVMYVGTQTRRETPNRTRTVQMSLIILRDHHQSPSLIFIWKENYPQVISRQLCNFYYKYGSGNRGTRLDFVIDCQISEVRKHSILK